MDRPTVTEVVVEVGPGTVRGPNEACAEWITTAIDCIDDEIALLDDRPVTVAKIWAELMSTVAGDGADKITLVYPAWWSSSRISLVRRAADTAAPSVQMVPQTTILRRLGDTRAAIVEPAAEFVIVFGPGMRRPVVARRSGDATADAEAVVVAVGAVADVVVGASEGIPGGERLGWEITKRLRATGARVTVVDGDGLRYAAVGVSEAVESTARRTRGRFGRRGAAVLAGVVASAAVGGGVLIRPADREAADMPTALMTEGSVAVMVPAAWRVQRVTSGPGSARVQVVSPNDPTTALHVTQSKGPPTATLAEVAAALHRALVDEPDGTFVDFNPADRRAGKAVVTYREARADKNVGWTVLIDGPVRIAIGCQSAPGREHLVRAACDHAVRTAHYLH
ncbi:type VII secretion-associated protein [Mycolicibacterium sp. XJ1819]